MQKVMTWLGCAILGLAVCTMCSTANARPKFMGAFKKAYPKVTAAKTKKCAVCHTGKGKDKKPRNAYANFLGKEIGKKNSKDLAKIKKAMKKVEGMKSEVEGKTYGDLFKAGKLPGSK